MKKQLYIHIGTGKTGTTTIQNTLAEQRPSLIKEHSLYYIHTQKVSQNYNRRCNNKIYKTKNRILKNLKSFIVNSECKKFLISSECFPGDAAEDINYIHQLFSDICDIKIIVYLRRQDEFIWSWYAQEFKSCKNKKTFSLSQTISKLRDADYILDYTKTLVPWKDVFGQDSILVNIFPPKSNLIDDFLSNLNINLGCDHAPTPKKHNPSITPEQILLAEFLKPLVSSYQFKLLQKPLPITFNYCKSLLSPEERKRILQDYNDSNKAVANLYLNREELFDDLSIPDQNTWTYPDIFRNGYIEEFVNFLENSNNINYKKIIKIIKDNNFYEK